MRLKTKRNLPNGTVKPRDPTRPAVSLDDLRPLMKHALLRANTQGITITTLDGHHPATIRALQARGLIHQRTSHKGRTSWRTTDTGRHVCGYHTPRYLHARGVPGTTTDARLAMRGEPEVVIAA